MISSDTWYDQNFRFVKIHLDFFIKMKIGFTTVKFAIRVYIDASRAFGLSTSNDDLPACVLAK